MNEVMRVISCLYNKKILHAQKSIKSKQATFTQIFFIRTKKKKKQTSDLRSDVFYEHKKQTSDFHSDDFFYTHKKHKMHKKYKKHKSKQATFTQLFFYMRKKYKKHKRHKKVKQATFFFSDVFYANKKHENTKKQLSSP